MNREALKGWRIGQVAGVPIEIAPSWFLVAVLIFWSLGAYVFPLLAPQLGFFEIWPASALATVLFFISLLGHELSHAVVSQRFGMRVRRIVLFVFGGISETVQEMPSAIAEFWVAIAGPLASVAFALGFMALSAVLALSDLPALAITFSWLAIANGILAAFNLLPGFPLDGGRVLRSIIWGATGNYLRATYWGSMAGKGVAIMLGAWGLARGLGAGDWFGMIWVGLLAFLLHGAADAAYRQAIMLDALRNIPVRDMMRLDVHALREDATLPEAVDEVMARYPDVSFPVADSEHQFRGILTAQQVDSIPPPFRPRIRVTELMRPIDDGAAVDPDTPATRALERIHETGVDPLPVCDAGRLVGLVGEGDLVRYLRWHPELVEKS